MFQFSSGSRFARLLRESPTYRWVYLEAACLSGAVFGAFASGLMGWAPLLLTAAGALMLLAFGFHFAVLVAIGDEPRLLAEERTKLRRSTLFLGLLVSPEIVSRIEAGDARLEALDR